MLEADSCWLSPSLRASTARQDGRAQPRELASPAGCGVQASVTSHHHSTMAAYSRRGIYFNSPVVETLKPYLCIFARYPPSYASIILVFFSYDYFRLNTAMREQGPTPASAEAGFIFSMSQPENPFLADAYFQRVLASKTIMTSPVRGQRRNRLTLSFRSVSA